MTGFLRAIRRRAWVPAATALGLAFSFIQAPYTKAEFNFSALGALSFGSGNGHAGITSPHYLMGGEFTWGIIDLLQVGVFYQNNVISYGPGRPGDLRYYGVMARISPPMTRIYFDGSLGYSFSSISGISTDAVPGTGVGIGLHNELSPFFDFGPRLGVRVLPSETGGIRLSRTLVDVSLLFTLRI